MALKFLNKKGWHTGSLRNLENVWKAEQKHEAEQKKLEELKTQLHKEREAEELRQLHVDAGLAPKQDRLEFLYDSGLGVGGGASASSSKPSVTETFVSERAAVGSRQKDERFVQQQSEKAAVGALFAESKPQSANDKWRKIHSDPLYLIKQQELAALDRIRKNPVKMQMLETEARKNMAPEKKSKTKSEKSDRHHKKKHKRDKDRDEENSRHKKSRQEKRHKRKSPDGDHSERRLRDDSPRSRNTHAEVEGTSRVPTRQLSDSSLDSMERTDSRRRKYGEDAASGALERSDSERRKHREDTSRDGLERTDSRRRRYREDLSERNHSHKSHKRSHGRYHQERRDGHRHRNDSP